MCWMRSSTAFLETARAQTHRTFAKGTKYKGKTTIDLGKGGKDSVVVENNKVKGGNLVITNFTKKDTITIGGETFTFKDIKNGAELPGVKVELR